MNNQPRTYMISSETFLNRCSENYRNIVTINIPPLGPLAKYVVRLQMPRLSHFGLENHEQCALALTSFRVGNNSYNQNYINGTGNFSRGLLYDDEIGDLFSFLLSNSYTIDTKLTNMMNASPVKINNKKIICFITYIGA